MTIFNNYWANRKWKNGHRVGSYVAYWKDVDGRTRHESGFEERQLALEHARTMSLETKCSLATKHFIAGKTLDQALAEYCSRKEGHKGTISQATHRLHEKHLATFFRYGLITTIDDLNISVVHAYQDRLLSDGYSINAQHSRLTTLRSFCSYAYHAGWLCEEIGKQITLPERTPRMQQVEPEPDIEFQDINQFMTADQCVDRLLLIDPDQRDLDIFWIRAIRFGIAARISIGQLFRLRWSDYDKATNKISVKRVGTEPSRDISLDPTLLGLIGHFEKEGTIFNRYPSIGAMKVAFNRRAKRWGLPGIRFRDVVHPQNLGHGRHFQPCIRELK